MTNQGGRHVDVEHITRAAQEVLTVRRVFGEAYERDGTLVIPVATVRGMTGAGSGEGGMAGPQPGQHHGRPGRPWRPAGGEDAVAPSTSTGGTGTSGTDTSGTGGGDGPGGEGAGGGGGLAVQTRPLGVYVVADDGVFWQPTLDLNRVILGGQVVLGIAVVATAWVLHRRRR